MLNKLFIIFTLITNAYSFTNIYFYNNFLKLQKTKLHSTYKMPHFFENKNIIQNIRNKININTDNNFKNFRYSDFLSAIENHEIDKTIFYDNNNKIIAIDINNNKYKLNALPNDPNLLKTLNDYNVDIQVLYTDKKLIIIDYVFKYIIFGLIILSCLSIISNRINNNLGISDLYNNFNLKTFNNVTITFDDVIGIDNAKIELEEIVDFLKESDKFTALGATIPRGILLEGPPGSGKTLLAKAVAGEAKVPFFYISGSEFIEMYVGTGAARVRTLFETAKQLSPSIIFIDEIDAIGKKRRSNNAPNSDERDQTLNQLLTEMDGFEDNQNIIVIGATNRINILDDALLRPGRFDRKVFIDIPNLKGRKDILKLYSKNKSIDTDINLNLIALRTPGFSGADLANLMNEAAILTARYNLTVIGNTEIFNALDRITLGAIKKNYVISKHQKKIIAYHEAGHAIVGTFTNNFDCVTKITITPRGNNRGLTLFTPDEDTLNYGLYTRHYLKSIISVALAGRIAEEIIFGYQEITINAANDFEKVTYIARQMITEFGMSDILGNVYINNNHYISLDTRRIIDNEVDLLVNSCYLYAKKLLLNNIDLLHSLAKLLIQNETVSYEELNYLINSKNLSII